MELPIDAHLSRIETLVQEHGALVIVAEPGAGKTTRVPLALSGESGRVICVQPRRIAASHAAVRVSEEQNEPVGGRIGYAVRFESKQSARTRVLYVTTGVFLRMLASGQTLGPGDTLVIDEFHERSLDVDLALCASVARRSMRPQDAPRLVVMSATLDAARLAAFIKGPVVDVPGRLHPVAIEYLAPRPTERPEQHIARACRNLLVRAREAKTTMRTLVFVPGRKEMLAARRAVETLRGGSGGFDFDVEELYGTQPFEEQKRVLRERGPNERPQIILATRIAETSLTVPDLRAVVDTGLSRRARADAQSGLSTLETRPSPLSSLTQRAGRAGRTGPGTCVRLFDEKSLAGRAPFDPPELATADCAGPLLLLASLGLLDPPFLDPPPQARWQAAKEQLRLLGALDAQGIATKKGLSMARLPVTPRTAAMLVAAKSHQVSFRTCMLAALVEEAGNVSALEDLWWSLRWLLDNEDTRRGEAIGLDERTLRAVRHAAERLRKLTKSDEEAPRSWEDEQSLLEQCLLAGYADRLGHVEGHKIQLVDGSRFDLPAEKLASGQYAVVLHATGTLGRQTARSLAVVSEDVVLELFLDRFDEQTTHVYQPSRDQVMRKVALRLGAMTVEESSAVASPSDETAQALLEALARLGMQTVLDVDALATLRCRLALASADEVELDALLASVLQEVSQSASSLSQIAAADPLALLHYALPADVRKKLEFQTPQTIDLPGRRAVVVHYQPDRPPWAASYLQEFFGMRDTPRVGSEALTLHLWAPNGRAVQVTSDLAGFWERHYPSLRKELSRRYPKHYWPDDPQTAKAVRLKRLL